jgi:hypothetical protein
VTTEIEQLEQAGLPDDPDALTAFQRSRVEKLVHLQGSIRTMWRDLAQRIGVSEADLDAPEDGGGEDGGPAPEDENEEAR